MTQEERQAAFEKRQKEMEMHLKQAVKDLQRQFDENPIQGVEYSYEKNSHYLPAADGVELYTEIYTPCEKTSFPVLVQRSCYPNQMDIYNVYGKEFAKRGYGYVLQICRGTGKSKGQWEPNINERSDGLVLLQWLNEQQWVESIGYFGASYLALTGWAIADAVPEKVKGMFLTVYGTDRFVSAYEKGLFRHDVLTGWAMGNAGRVVTADYMESCLYRPHENVDTDLWGGRLDWYQDWIHSTRSTDAYWQQGWWKELQQIPSKVKVPVYIVGSWYDHHFGSLMETYKALSPQAKNHCWMDIGCWTHMSEPCIAWGKQENLENKDVNRILQWFDMLLKNKDLPSPRVKTYVIREDRWQTLENWPINTTKTAKFYLDDNKNLSLKNCTEKEYSFNYNPENPCPTHGAESVLMTITEAGSLQQPTPDYRQDVISFLSDELKSPIEICGKIKVHLNVATDGDDTSYTAKLMEVFPDGRAYNIRGGITTISADLPQDVEYEKNTATMVCVDMWDIVWTLQPKSRLRLDISSSDFPQYAVHSNYRGIWSQQKQTRIAKQTIFTGEKSYIELPITQ